MVKQDWHIFNHTQLQYISHTTRFEFSLFVCNRGDTILRQRRTPHWFKSVQTRELGQSPICCTGGARHHAPEAHNVRSIPYPYMKVITTYNYVAGLQSLQWLLLFPWTSQHLIHCWNQMFDWPHNGLIKQNSAHIIFVREEIWNKFLRHWTVQLRLN